MALNLDDVQQQLRQLKLDGWLLYDFRKMNDLACAFLQIPAHKKLTRRFFYWIPAQGTPQKIVHRIEPDVLQHLPGETQLYTRWQELRHALAKVLERQSKIAMEYSPFNALPTVSKVDGGTIDLVRDYGLDLVSSADLLQAYTSVWNEAQLKSHLAAAKVLENAAAQAWNLVAERLGAGQPVNELDVQQFLLAQFEAQGCIADAPPICAVNAHSADPHFACEARSNSQIRTGDFLLIDLWCKQKDAYAVYADITCVAVASERPQNKQQELFEIVKQARDAAMQLLHTSLSAGQPVRGSDLDDACRAVIEHAGYGEFFTHRTGHSLGEQVHGPGANIDNFETRDERQLLPGTCFTIEPGIYLPNEFGVRLEHNVYIEKDGRSARVTGKLQEQIACLL